VRTLEIREFTLVNDRFQSEQQRSIRRIIEEKVDDNVKISRVDE